jgi:hypothetical protein
MICEIKNDVKTLEFKCCTHGTLRKVIKEMIIIRNWVQVWNITCKHSDFYISLPLPRKNHNWGLGFLRRWILIVLNCEMWRPWCFAETCQYLEGRHCVSLICKKKKQHLGLYIAHARLAKFWSRKMGVSQYICRWWMMHVEIVGSRKVYHRNLLILQEKCNVIEYFPIVTVTRTFISTSRNFCITTKVMYIQTRYWGAFA